jgi:hypothetical protein
MPVIPTRPGVLLAFTAMLRLCTTTEIIQKVTSVSLPAYRPTIPPFDNSETNALVPLMQDCWNEQPEERPAFTDIMKTLKRINKGELVLKMFAKLL